MGIKAEFVCDKADDISSVSFTGDGITFKIEKGYQHPYFYSIPYQDMNDELWAIVNLCECLIPGEAYCWDEVRL